MYRRIFVLPVLFFFFFPLKAATSLSFDFDWKFALGDYPESIQRDFDDSSWRILQLPHDWSIEGTYHPTENQTDWQSGYLPAGIGWYRKTFSFDDSWKNRKIRILFDGVYLNSSVWLNGHLLGKRPSGYISFEYDLTPYLQQGENVLTVKVDHSEPLSARWYTGSGIYRHVWLLVGHSVYVPTWGVYFTTPEVSVSKAISKIRTILRNDSKDPAKITLETILKTRDGKKVASARNEVSCSSGKQEEVIQQLEVDAPLLWSPQYPQIYLLETNLKDKNKLIDSRQMLVGIREASYSVKGFVLNGKALKIQGVCDHHTAGALGAAIPDQSLERRLKILKAMGCNAIRTAHNPYAPEFYTMCDTLGFIVMNEAFDGWEKPKAIHDYGNYFKEWWKKDLTDFILRDRNHPCVFFWSIGNEVSKGSPETQQKLVSLIHSLDPGRPVTQGGTDPTRGMTTDYDKNFRSLDLVGFNGNGEEVGEFEKFHQLRPDKYGVGTEVPHTYQTRGVYRTKTAWRRRDFPAPWELKTPIPWDEFKHRVFEIPDLSENEVFPEESEYPYYQSSYDNASVRISARKSWQRTSSFPWLFGEFRWGSFDYLGEAEWPQRCGNFGIIDICGFPKDHYYLYQSLWSEKPMVHLLPHWTHQGKEGVSIPVVVYTNCESVELFLNNKSLGEQIYTGEQLVWQVPYESGEIKAVARNNRQTVAQKSYCTAGKANKISMQADRPMVRANRKDVVHFEIDIMDAKGNMCPMASNDIRFIITGPARLIAVDNGDPVDVSPYKIPQRKAFRGKAFLIVQTTGESGTITVKAVSEGLKPAEVKLVSLSD